MLHSFVWSRCRFDDLTARTTETVEIRITYGDELINDEVSTFEENGVGQNSRLSVQVEWRVFDASNVQVRMLRMLNVVPLTFDLLGTPGA